MLASAAEEDREAEQPPNKAYSFFRLGAGVTLGGPCPNCFILRNAYHAGDRLIDHVDDCVFDDRDSLSWRFS
jgi:hypothetical protein